MPKAPTPPRTANRPPTPHLTASAPVPVIPPVPNPYWAQRWAWYFLSLFIPLAGIVIGLFFYDQESPEARKVGKHSLWIGFLAWVILPIFVTMAVLFLGSMALISWLSGAMGPVD